MSDEKFDQFLRASARDYNAPPSTPRDEIWARIDGARRDRRAGDVVPIESHRAMRRPSQWIAIGTGIAAALVIGVALGRLSIHGVVGVREGPPVASTSGAGENLAKRPATALPYRLAALQYLGQTEALLTTVHNDASTGRVDAHVTRWAHDLLGNTQLLLDSPAADDPQLKRLLGDLELVLEQIARLPADRTATDTTDLDMIEQAIRHHDVLTRIRTTIPSGQMPVGS